ncbi:MAG TPA: thioredoxin family protein [Fluviicola sp.]|nr:thioredoxin family protein [Fluviicola sp.]
MKTRNLFAVALIALVSAAFTFSPSEDKQTGLKIGDKLPMADTEMKATDGSAYSLSKVMGKKGLVVVFSCNTCPFVVGSESFAGWEVQYNSLATLAKESNIGFVLVNSNAAKRTGDDSMEAMITRASDKAYTMPYLVDENAALADAFGAKTTPHVYFFNENNELIYQGAIDNTVDGKRKEDKNYLQQAMREHVAGKKVSENTTPPRGCSIKRVV